MYKKVSLYENFKNRRHNLEAMVEDPLPKELYDILACPDDKGDLVYTSKKDGLKCKTCKFVFPIKEGIPILLPKSMQEKSKV